MRHRRAWAVALTAAGLLLAIAVSATALAADRTVHIAGFAFSPNPVSINVGDTITWTNDDGVAHNATGNGGGFATGQIGAGTSKSVTFHAAGSFAYHCTIHPSMTGTVIVRASTGGGTSGGTAPDTDMARLDPGHDGTWLSIVLAALGLVMLVGTMVVERLLRRRAATGR
jgi:plastocyanin